MLILLFGGGFGYSRYGYRGGIGIGGVLLIILISICCSAVGGFELSHFSLRCLLLLEPSMSMIVWILLGLGLGLLASKLVSTTGEGTVVDILLGIVGGVVGGWMFNLFGGTGMTGFDIGSVYSAGAAVIGAIILLALYHAFFRRRML